MQRPHSPRPERDPSGRPTLFSMLGILLLATAVAAFVTVWVGYGRPAPAGAAVAAAPPPSPAGKEATAETLTAVIVRPSFTPLARITAAPDRTSIPTPTNTRPVLPPTATPTAVPTATPFAAYPTFTPDPLAPLPTPLVSQPVSVRVPIFMYHYVNVPAPDADEIRVALTVHTEAFRAQMAYLRDHGFTTIDLYDLALAITQERPLPPKPVILTFDDGYRDHYEVVFPILREYGHTGTFFVITEFVDREIPAYLTWPMIEEMAAAGMRIEPHTKTHIDLRGEEVEELVYQILGSLQTVEAHIGYRPRFFAYPGGSYDDATIDIVRQLDFWGALTTQSGKWHGYLDRYEWKRIRLRHLTTLGEFAALAE